MSASAGAVRGPVEIIVWPQSSGISVTSPRSSVISGWSDRICWTQAENPSRSTANAPPAGTLCRSAAVMMMDPMIRISS